LLFSDDLLVADGLIDVEAVAMPIVVDHPAPLISLLATGGSKISTLPPWVSHQPWP
jgi:hypothetical protein